LAELYENIPTKVDNLIGDVKNGKIGLPDLQRPFVWQDSKVRDLLDSMYRGFPIGYIMLWQSPSDYDRMSQIGKNEKIYKVPDDLVIDGQQRLTALLGAIEGIEVKDKNYHPRFIKISFNPLTENFEVWSQAYERSAEYISAISEVFSADRNHAISKFRKHYIKGVNKAREKNGEPELTEDDEIKIEYSLNDLLNLKNYSLPTMRISEKADEEDVAEIFVRVNSGGQKLTEKNFIETLLAVFDNSVYDQINCFCESSRIPKDGTAYNHIIEVDPSHLIRMAVGFGFHRARLKYAYQLLRGKNLKTGDVTNETRSSNLAVFKKSLNAVTKLNNWHTYLGLFEQAGYMKGDFVAATNAVVYCYVMYLIGKYEYNVKTSVLNKVITKWIYMTTVTAFYSGSTESTVESMFADLRDIKTADAYLDYLDHFIESRFTDDYFNVTLIKDLTTSSTRSPAWLGYIAAINVLGTPMLFSTSILSSYLVAGANGTKNAVDRHHIFPKHYLEENGYTDDRDRNQVANYTYIDYLTNINISDKPPIEYVSEFREKLGEDQYLKTCKENALPKDFEKMDYPQFLSERRKLMAGIIRKGYERLCLS
jgi:hypothetical protein